MDRPFRIWVSEVVAALAGIGNSHILLLLSDVARDALDGSSAGHWSRKSARSKGPGAGDCKSRDLPGRGVCAGGTADAVAPSPGRGDGRRAPDGNATSAERIVLF